MKHKISCKIGDEVLIKVEKGEDYSLYRLRITRQSFEGEGLDDCFLKESTGYEPEESNPS